MNKERANALLHWVNSVSTITVQSIRDFSSPANTRILIDVLHLIDRDNRDDGTCTKGGNTVQEMVSYIITFLEGIYHNLDGIVSSNLIASNDDDLEIGKLITLLLCGAVQGNNVLHFIEKIHRLDNKVQSHLKIIIENVLHQVEMGQLCSRSIANLLQEEVVFMDKQDCVFSPSLTYSPFRETVFSDSPLVSLMLSPQMKSKQNQFAANKLHQEVKKLKMDLVAQHHVQSTIEEELAEKNKDIDAKDAKIRELKKELAQTKRIVDELESLEHFKNDFEKAEKENNKLKHRIAELEDYRVQHSNLEERTASFLKEKDSFEEQVKEMKQIQARCERYKQQSHHWEFQASELQAALNRREEEIARLVKQRDEALHAATESTELWKSRQVPEPDSEEEFLMQVPSSPIKLAPNLDSRLIELEFENERLKKQLDSAVDPLELQRVKEELEDVKQSKKAYEEKFVDAKCKILEQEEGMTQLQDQSRVREETLQEKMSQDCQSKIRNVTEELDSIHIQDREKLLQKLNDAAKQKDSLRAEFSLELEIQKQLVKKAEDDGNKVRDMYESMMTGVNNELVNEMKKYEELSANLQQTKLSSDQKTIDFQQEKFLLSTEITQYKEKEKQLIEDAGRLKEEIGRLLQSEKTLRENENDLEKKLEGLKTSGKELGGELDRLNGEIKSLKEEESKLLEEKSSRESVIASLKEKEAMMLEEKVQFSLEVASLKKDFTTELKSMNESIERENEAKLSRMSKVTEDLNKKIDKANKDIAERDQSLEDFIQTCSKLKQEMDSTEARLLDVTRERNDMSDELENAFLGLKAAADNIEELREKRQQDDQKMKLQKANVKNLAEQMAKQQDESKEKQKFIIEEASKKCGALQEAYEKERNKQEKACHGLKAASDNIEELRETIQETEQKLAQERSNVKNLKEQLEKQQEESKKKEKMIVGEASKKNSALEEAYEKGRNEQEKACHGLKAAADNIEELRQELQESGQKITQEKSKVKSLEEQLEKQQDESKEKQKMIFEEASNKNNALEEAYEKERNNWKKKRDTATEETVALRKEIFESSQKHSAEMIEVRRLSQEKEEHYGIEEKKMREEIRGFIANLANERVTSSELQDKLKQSEKQREEIQNALGEMKKASELEINELKENIANEKVTSNELQDQLQQFEKQQEEVQNTLEEMKKASEIKINELKKKVDESTTPLEELKHSFENLKEEKENIVSTYEQCKAKWNEKESELNGKVSESMKELTKLKEIAQVAARDEEEVQSLTEHVEKLEQENSELEDCLQEEQGVSRRQGTQVKSLEAQLQHAERSLREQKQTLQNFQNQSENLKKRKQMLIEVEKVIPVHNVQEFLDESSSTDEDPDMKVDNLSMSSGSTTSITSTFTEFTKSTTSLSSLARSSLLSTSSTHERAVANRRHSVVYFQSNTSPTRRANSGAPLFVAADEFARNIVEESSFDGFDWGRIAELERRNTICPPHLKTSYPIETQTRPNVENEKRNTLQSSISDTSFRSRKRKSLEEPSAASKLKLSKGQPSSKSEGHLKHNKSKKLTDRMSSKINSLRSRDNQNKEAGKKKSNGGNLAFSIDITPPSKKPSKSNMSLRSFRSKKEPEAPTKHAVNKPVQRENTAFMIENSPPKKVAKSSKSQRRRTINRSTASTRLVCEKDKEVYKIEKEKEYLKKKALKQSNNK